MDESSPSHTSEPHPREDAQPTWPVQEPTTDISHDREPRALELSDAFAQRLEQHYLNPGESAAQLAEQAALVLEGHKGRHHWAGHTSGRYPSGGCGVWRPMAGVSCPVCPTHCPVCRAHYVNPFPVDARDG